MIYFIQEGQEGPIKIGRTSDDAKKRLAAMQTHNPTRLHLRATMEGDNFIERDLHARFAEWHIRGEWFRPAPDIFEFITDIDSGEHPEYPGRSIGGNGIEDKPIVCGDMVIYPPVKKGQRRRPTQSVQMYKSSIELLDDLVLLKRTSRVEYLRWLVECAEAGAVDIGREVQEAGYDTLAEFCAAQRNETLDNWTDEHEDGPNASR